MRNDFQRQTIFVMIPSLRDDKVFKTIIDCISKAEYPERLYFGISLQGVSLSKLQEVLPSANIRSIILPETTMFGVGITRSFLYGIYNSEDYVLSIDCHTEFMQHWDTSLIQSHLSLPNPERAVITQTLSDIFMTDAQIPEYGDPSNSKNPNDINSHYAMQYLGIFENLTNQEYLVKNYASPHFVFAPGSIVSLGYPKNYIFGEEDFLLSVLLFCNGYDLYMLRNTYMTTLSKDRDAIKSRSNFFTRLLAKSPYYSLADKIGEHHEINYPDPKELSRHLLKIGSKQTLYQEIEKQYLSLVLNGKNDEFDLNGLERSIDDFFAFHNVSELVKPRLLKKMKSYLQNGTYPGIIN